MEDFSVLHLVSFGVVYWRSEARTAAAKAVMPMFEAKRGVLFKKYRRAIIV